MRYICWRTPPTYLTCSIALLLVISNLMKWRTTVAHLGTILQQIRSRRLPRYLCQLFVQGTPLRVQFCRHSSDRRTHSQAHRLLSGILSISSPGKCGTQPTYVGFFAVVGRFLLAQARNLQLQPMGFNQQQSLNTPLRMASKEMSQNEYFKKCYQCWDHSHNASP